MEEVQMKKFIYSATKHKIIKCSDEVNSQAISSNGDIVRFLQSKGIDTTKYEYELKYVFFARFSDEPTKVKFSCPGDYLALFSTRMAGVIPKEAIPNFENIDDYFGIDRFVNIVDKYPDYSSLYRMASGAEWFGREEFGGITLTNLTTGKVLVKDEYEEYYEKTEEDWED